MIGNGKIFNPDNRSSAEPNFTRLSYEMLFQEKAKKDNDYQTNREVTELLEKKDHEWQIRLEEAKQQVRKEAYDQGYSEGQQEAKENISQHIKPVREAILEVDERMNSLMNELRPHLATLVFELTEKVLSVPVYNEELRQQVSEEIHRILGEIEEGTKIKIAVSEEDFELIRELNESSNIVNNMDIHYDKDLKPGEYRIETRYEMIVKNFRKMLNDLKESTIIAGSLNLSDDVGVH